MAEKKRAGDDDFQRFAVMADFSALMDVLGPGHPVRRHFDRTAVRRAFDDRDAMRGPEPEWMSSWPAAGAKLKAAASDFGEGIAEAPVAVASGALDAARSMAIVLDDLGEAKNSKTNLRVPVPLTGSETLDKIIANPLRAFVDLTDRPAPQQSATGQAIREGARLATGFLPASRFVSARYPTMPAVPRAVGAAASSEVTTSVEKEPWNVDPALVEPVLDKLREHGVIRPATAEEMRRREERRRRRNGTDPALWDDWGDGETR